MKYADDRVYEGYCQNSYEHGKGTLYYPNGDVYAGDWQYGEKNGIGTLKCADGSVYEGGFKDDQIHGKGYLLYPNGDVCEGYW